MITIIDYGSGNIQAIGNIYSQLNIEFTIAKTPDHLDKARKLLLPGVGAFDKTMEQLVNSGLKQRLDHLVLEKKVPVLGICVGMQILGKKSEEGELSGLGWIDGMVKKIDVKKLVRKPHLPHMGWNNVRPKFEHPILKGVDLDRGFYFLHSYYFWCSSEHNVLCTTEYGDTFASGVYSNNIYGMQFHPEKSHSNGIQVLKNFAEL